MGKSEFTQWVENQTPAGQDQQAFAAILGLTPSRGARSPTLWNAAFEKLNLRPRMFPFDVTENKFAHLVAALQKDAQFLGGAVTMPYKTQILSLLDEIEPEAQDAGAVNCVFKKNGRLVGTNTDGLGALLTLREAFGNDLGGAKVLLAGLGGAGSAVAAYVGNAIGKSGALTITNRSRPALEAVKNRLESRTQVNIAAWPVPLDAGKFDILINATSLGFEAPRQDARGWFVPKFFTPFGPGPDSVRCASKEEADAQYADKASTEISANVARSLQFLEKQKGAFVYDVIYQPKETVLLSLAAKCGLRTANGLAMNLEQAVIAFDKATSAAGLRAANLGEVRKLMSSL